MTSAAVDGDLVLVDALEEVRRELRLPADAALGRRVALAADEFLARPRKHGLLGQRTGRRLRRCHRQPQGDVAGDLSDSKIGTQVNRALQEVIASGYELLPLHHQVKQQGGQGAPTKLSNVYGSRWLTAGMGSVLLLWGEPGDLVVDLKHLKQPEGDIGPLNIFHDHSRGTSTIHERIDLLEALANATHGLTVADAAALMFEKSAPSRTRSRRRGGGPASSPTPAES